MHTDHSYDCATPGRGAARRGARARPRRDRDHRPQRDLRRARRAREGRRDQGDRRRGGQDRRPGRGDRPVHRGEDPARDDAAETIAEIKRQGGLVYVPHPFDRMHSVPDYEHLWRCSTTSTRSRCSTRASRSPSSTRRRSGSPPSIGCRPAPAPTRTSPRGSARCGSGCATSTAPQEFLESLRDADIVRNPASLLYVQALKFLQTKAMPAAARRASRRAVGGPGARGGRCEGASPDALARTSPGAVQFDRDARDRRRDPREVPRARDPRAEHVRARNPVVPRTARAAR